MIIYYIMLLTLQLHVCAAARSVLYGILFVEYTVGSNYYFDDRTYARTYTFSRRYIILMYPPGRHAHTRTHIVRASHKANTIYNILCYSRALSTTNGACDMGSELFGVCIISGDDFWQVFVGRDGVVEGGEGGGLRNR